MKQVIFLLFCLVAVAVISQSLKTTKQFKPQDETFAISDITYFSN